MGNTSENTPAVRHGRMTQLLAVCVMIILCLIGSIPARAADKAGTLRNTETGGFPTGVVVGDDIDTTKVRTITFQNTKPTTGTCWDAGGGAGENNDSVKGCATASKVDSTMYDVVYGADGAYPGFPDDSSHLFSGNTADEGFPGLVSFTNLDKIDTSNVTDMYSMFSACKSLVSLDVSKFDTSKVTNMSFMFSSCCKLASLDVSNFITSKVTRMNSMFMDCASLTSLDVSKFDTSNVTAMSFMFLRCTSLKVLDISGFDTSHLGASSGYYCMFSQDPKLHEIRLGAKYVQKAGLSSEHNGPDLGEPDGDAARSGYVNIGRWRNMATGEVYDSPQNIPAGVAAIYTPFRPVAYTVRFDANKGGGSMDNQSFTYNEAQNLRANTFTRDGYTFAGWGANADGSGKSYADKESVKNLADKDDGTVTLYAKWAARADVPYTVNHFLQAVDGSYDMSRPDESQTLTGVTDTNTAAKAKTYEGFVPGVFAQGKIAGDGSTVVSIKYARNEYGITYDPKGGTLPDSVPKTRVYGEETKLPAPSKNGYTFDGWYDENGNKIDTIPADAKGVTVAAKWTANAMTVTYDANGGNGEVPAYMGRFGDILTIPENGFTGNGCDTFKEWNARADGKGASYKPGDKLPALTGDIVLYAQWNAISCPTPDAGEDATPVGPTPVNPAPADATPSGSTPVDPTPSSPTPSGTASSDVVPADSAPSSPTPSDATPTGVTPPDSAPADSRPSDIASSDTATADAPLAQTGTAVGGVVFMAIALAGLALVLRAGPCCRAGIGRARHVRR